MDMWGEYMRQMFGNLTMVGYAPADLQPGLYIEGDKVRIVEEGGADGIEMTLEEWHEIELRTVRSEVPNSLEEWCRESE